MDINARGWGISVVLCALVNAEPPGLVRIVRPKISHLRLHAASLQKNASAT
jgi:hypothetical protein